VKLGLKSTSAIVRGLSESVRVNFHEKKAA
jgi:hypothetical protein